MRRREFIVLAAVGATIWPLVSSAQKAPILIGFLGSQAPPKPSDAQGNAIIQGFLDNGLDDRFHETGIEKPTSMELEVCWWIPRLRRTERGAASWELGGKRLRWR